jgi:hypothetical protein
MVRFFGGHVDTLREGGASGGIGVGGGLTYGEFVFWFWVLGFFSGCGGIIWVENLNYSSIRLFGKFEFGVDIISFCVFANELHVFINSRFLWKKRDFSPSSLNL